MSTFGERLTADAGMVLLEENTKDEAMNKVRDAPKNKHLHIHIHDCRFKDDNFGQPVPKGYKPGIPKPSYPGESYSGAKLDNEIEAVANRVKKQVSPKDASPFHGTARTGKEGRFEGFRSKRNK